MEEIAAPVTVRKTTVEDLDRIVEVHSRSRASYYQDGGAALESIRNPTIEHQQRTGWGSALRSTEKRVWCAMAGNELVGVVAMGPPLASDVDARKVGQLYQIHVSPGRWRGGIGSTLHAIFAAYLAEASLPTGLLEVWERNSRARAFYAKHGWTADGQTRLGGPDNSAYVCMRLDRHRSP
ncbi:N-acetyltransferase family protein [Micromonospora haikouensis]|uniref:GNAT family N-acetyltransferase n=1 Tax=Micromonospora haikouensis TaxID=686309 RepID=UPI003D70D782